MRVSLDRESKHMYTYQGYVVLMWNPYMKGEVISMSINLDEYEDKLKTMEIVKESQIPFMVNWVKKYIRLGSPEEAEYADILYREGKEDWKIRQALDSVKLFRGAETGKMGKCSVNEPMKNMREKLTLRHYAASTKKTYLGWCSRYMEYCDRSVIDPESEESYRTFLSQLALRRKVSSSTQNQAFNAILFLFRNVWEREPERIDSVRARKPRRLPVVLSVEEVRKVLAATRGITGLVIRLIYSSGLRLSEAVRLRVQDVNLEGRSILVRGGKGDKDRTTVVSSRLIPELRAQIDDARIEFERIDIPVSLPNALELKYTNAGKEWNWQYVFCAEKPYMNPVTGELRRHHIHSSSIQKAMRRAVKESGISRRAGVHTLRHCFATHLLMSGTDLCEIQELLGHRSLETTRVYLHVMKELKHSVESPLDLLAQ